MTRSGFICVILTWILRCFSGVNPDSLSGPVLKVLYIPTKEVYEVAKPESDIGRREFDRGLACAPPSLYRLSNSATKPGVSQQLHSK